MSAGPTTPYVAIPELEGRRSTTALGRAVVADALRMVDPAAAASAEAERDWRSGYVRHFARAVEAGADDGAAALDSARAGLASLQQRMQLVDETGERPLSEAFAPSRIDHEFETSTVSGTARAVCELEVPYGEGILRGAALIDQLNRWADAGVVEPAFAEAVNAVVRQPEALRLRDRPVVLLGAGAALGPLAHLTRWGVRVLAADVPATPVQDRIAAYAVAGASVVNMPHCRVRTTPGASLNREPVRLAGWIDQALGDGPAPLVVASFYADGGTHVELTSAHIAITDWLRTLRPDTALGYLATPTDAFLVPEDAVNQAQARWQDRRWHTRTRAGLRTLSADRLFRPAYPHLHADADGTPWGFANTLVTVQGPNYALAKRAQRWHAMRTAAEGALVSANVAPSSWTTSVTKNRALAAAFRAADRFGVEIFDPATSSALMAAKLAADICGLSSTPARHPEAMFSNGAAHGGLWRQPYEPLSALGVAGLIGLTIRTDRKESR